MGRSAAPRIFRNLLPVRNLAASRRFYETLLGVRGRPVAVGRVYFDCGPVLLGLLDFGAGRRRAFGVAEEPIYFATSGLEAIHRRARRLRALDPGRLHGDPESPLGEIVRRPWGERSFYASDPDGHRLCFVDARTLYTGTAAQIAALTRATAESPPRRRPSRRR